MPSVALRAAVLPVSALVSADRNVWPRTVRIGLGVDGTLFVDRASRDQVRQTSVIVFSGLRVDGDSARYGLFRFVFVKSCVVTKSADQLFTRRAVKFQPDGRKRTRLTPSASENGQPLPPPTPAVSVGHPPGGPSPPPPPRKRRETCARHIVLHLFTVCTARSSRRVVRATRNSAQSRALSVRYPSHAVARISSAAANANISQYIYIYSFSHRVVLVFVDVVVVVVVFPNAGDPFNRSRCTPIIRRTHM